jgi:hypothetical protein
MPDWLAKRFKTQEGVPADQDEEVPF